MAVLTVSGLKKSYGTQDLFADASFLIEAGERVALIGANGTGKSTLLKIICGEETADGGIVRVETGNVGYLPQEPDLPDASKLQPAVCGLTPELLRLAEELDRLEKRIAENPDDGEAAAKMAETSHAFDTLDGFMYRDKAKAVLSGLGFSDEEMNQTVSTLSGGQKTRAALARILLTEPDFLILDEPTNHLDIEACTWLQDYLRTRYGGAALIVSHDRYFMDRVVTRVLEIDGGKLTAYRGGYSEYAKTKRERIEEQRRLYKAQQKEIARLEAAIQTLFSHRKFSRRDSKIKQLERIERISKTTEAKGIRAEFKQGVRSGKDVIRLSHISKRFGNKVLFSDVTGLVTRGSRVGVVGPNGSGKTTMLRIIADEENPTEGVVTIGHNVHMIYYAQQFEDMDPDNTVLEELVSGTDVSTKEARDLLASFLFMGDDAFKTVSVLSGGERSRLSLAKILAGKPNLLLLDEPTNHLDIVSREALEDALSRFDGTLVAVSHDRYFLDAVCGEIAEIKDGKFTTYLGNYSRYFEKTMYAESEAKREERGAEKKTRPMSSLREKERVLREMNKRRKGIEEEIETLEAETETLGAALCDEENYKTGKIKEIKARYDELLSKTEKLYSEWEKLCEDIAETEAITV
ncbi:MAG: ABC-F family ATP-binding cassette domain-containing protein [Abditibacteriota bacterium]|nr:ABC-F family ATP-binding cassette domain-containing protein [Abditibacteriota bacterium]